MCQDLLQSLQATHTLSRLCIINKNLCHNLDEKMLGLIPVIQHRLDDHLPIPARSYHRLNSIILKINSLYQKSQQKSWTNTFHKHSIQLEYQEILRELELVSSEEPDLTPIPDPILVKIHSNLSQSRRGTQHHQQGGPPRRGSVKLLETETESVESTLSSLHTGLQNKSESLISLALGDIARLSTGSYTRQLAYSNQGGCDVICTALRLYSSHRKISEHGALSLYNLSQVPTNLQHITEAGGPLALIQILTLHSDNVSLIREVCHTIDFLCQNSDECRQKFHEERVSAILFRALQSQYQSLEMSEICLSTIYELGYEGIPSPSSTLPQGSVEGKDSLGTNLDISSAVSVPSPSRPSSSSSATSEIRSICQLLLKIYSFHHDTQIIIRYITWILINFSIDTRNHQLLRELDLFQCLIKCLIQYPKDEEICESCLGAVIYLCQNNPINQTAFSYYDISYALGQVLETHLLPPAPSPPPLPSSSSPSPPPHPPLTTTSFTPSSLILEMTCIAIIQLTSDDHYENITHLAIPSVCHGLVTLIESKYHDEETGPALLKEAYVAIRNLCHSSRSNTLLMQSFGGSDALLQSLEFLTEDPPLDSSESAHVPLIDSDLILRGVTALYSFLRHQHTPDLLDHTVIVSGGFTLLMKIMRRHADHEILTENLTLIISHLLFSYLSHDTSFIESSFLPLSSLHSQVSYSLNIFPANEIIVENCFLLLSDILQRNDCSNTPISTETWNETAVTIQIALQRCYEFSTVCSLGCHLLDTLLSSSSSSLLQETERHVMSIAHADGICDLVMSSLKFHSTSLSTTLMVCRLFRSLIQTASVNIILMSSCGCCEVFSSLLNKLVSQSVSALFSQEQVDLIATVSHCIQILSTKTTNQHIFRGLETRQTLCHLLTHREVFELLPQELETMVGCEEEEEERSVQSDDDESEKNIRHALDIDHVTTLECFRMTCEALLVLMASERANEGSLLDKREVEERLTSLLLQRLIFFLNHQHRTSRGDGDEDNDDDDDDLSRDSQQEIQDEIMEKILQLIELDLLSVATPHDSPSSLQWHTRLTNQVFELLTAAGGQLPKHLTILRILVVLVRSLVRRSLPSALRQNFLHSFREKIPLTAPLAVGTDTVTAVEEIKLREELRELMSD
jgi:hypothetical protein